MSAYTDYHHRWLRRPVSTYWWLEKPAYLAFILRESSCMFVAWVVLDLLRLIRAVGAGEAAYQQFLAWSATPRILIVNLVAFVFVTFHAVTFFQAAPQAMVVHAGGRRVPARLVLLGHYAAWLVVSAVLVWMLTA